MLFCSVVFDGGGTAGAGGGGGQNGAVVLFNSKYMQSAAIGASVSF